MNEDRIAKNLLLEHCCKGCRYNVSPLWCSLTGTKIPDIKTCKVWRNKKGSGI